MTRRWIANLVLALAVVALGLYAWQRPGAVKEPQFPVSALKADVVRRIEVLATGEPPWVLERNGGIGGNWRLVAPFAARADRNQVARLLDLLSATSRVRLARTDLKSFDLEAPALRLRFDQLELGLGTANPLTQEHYLLGPDAVFLVPGFLAEQINAKPGAYLARELFGEGETPVRIELKDFRVERRNGKWIREPAATSSAGPGDLTRFADDWRFASSMLTRNARTPPTAPPETLTIGLEDRRTLTLEILQREPELVLRRPDEGLQFHFSAELGKRLLDPTVAAH